MRFLPCVLLIALVLAACSDSESPTSPPPVKETRYHLRPFYSWRLLQNGDPDLWETQHDKLVLRFHDGVTEEARADIFQRYNLTIIFPEHSLTREMVVGIADAFATAPKLWREDAIQFVGPVFDGDPRPDCGIIYPMNSIGVKGDRTAPSVVAALQEAGATLLHESPWDPDDRLYELPWDDPNKWFDLAKELGENPAVEYAEPNLLYHICLDGTLTATDSR